MNEKRRDTSFADNNFTLLRLVAALFVLISHSFGILEKGLAQPQLWYGENRIILSDVGLAIFFTISGFLVTKSLLDSNSYQHYLWKRFVRIVPALVVVIVFSIISGAFVSTLSVEEYLFNRITLNYFFINLSLLVNSYVLPGVFSSLHNTSVNASIWTICLEVKFYVGLLLLSVLRIIEFKWLLLSGFILFQLTRIYFEGLHLIQIPFIHMHVYFLHGTYFYLGIIAYRFKDEIPFKWFYANILMAIAFITANTIVEPITTAVFVAYFFIIIGTSKAVINLRSYDLSYGLYLYAFPVQQLLLLHFGYSINVWLHIALSAALASLLALLSWRFIEKPFLLKKNIVLIK